MAREDEILAEFHKLIDEQLEMLKQKLTREQMMEYAAREKKMAQLLEEISRDGFSKA
jgi:hypothetical protein